MCRRLKGFLIIVLSMLLLPQECRIVLAQQAPKSILMAGFSFLLPSSTSRSHNRPGEKKSANLWLSSSSSSLLDANKPVKKLWKKLQEWKTRCGKSGKMKRLLIDGNNVRGVTSFRWSPVDLLRYVAYFAREEDLQEHIVVVLDHGNQKYATMLYNESIAIMFAGLTQTADDVIVSCALETNDDSSSLAVVTNDVGLRHRLRSLTQQQQQRSNKDEVTRVFEMDSTRFVGLLLLHHDSNNHCTAPTTTNKKSLPLLHNGQEDSMEMIVQTTQDQIEAFHSHQRSASIIRKGSGHPINQHKNLAFRKREQPWERVVIAEAMRLALFETKSCTTKKYSSASLLHGYVTKWNRLHGVDGREEDTTDDKNIIIMRNGSCSNDSSTKIPRDLRKVESTPPEEHPSIRIPLRLDKANHEMLQKYQRWAWQRSGQVDPKKKAHHQDTPDPMKLPLSLKLPPVSKRASRRQRQE